MAFDDEDILCTSNNLRIKITRKKIIINYLGKILCNNYAKIFFQTKNKLIKIYKTNNSRHTYTEWFMR